MSHSEFSQINHGSAILAIAIAPDDTLLACGGSGAVTVWEIATGQRLWRFDLPSTQVHTLTFSPDSKILAAASVWRGIWMWELQSGTLLNHKPPTKSRRIPTLFFPATHKAEALPRMRTSSIFRATPIAFAPNGQWIAEGNIDIRIQPYRGKGDMSHLDASQYPLTRSGVRCLAWAGNSTALALCGDGWAGIWLPFEHKFFARPLPFTDFVYAIAGVGSGLQVICAVGKPNPVVVDIPAEPMLTRWEKFKQQVEWLGTSLSAKRDWNWNVTSWGYDGVMVQANTLLWYHHTHNTMDGSAGAVEQTFGDFLASGTTQQVPEEVLAEVYQVVQAMIQR